MLDEKLKEIILKKHEELLGQGKLRSEAELQGYYRTFQQRFGPQVLSSLDGEALLEYMQDNSNRGSLIYWLEFKNDEEFPTPIFGSIAGGNATKFRVYRRAETGEWGSRDIHNYPTSISVEEALALARSNRDQLVAGAEIISNLPSEPTKLDYVDLQRQMDEAAPDLVRLGWAHKYFYLLFPEYLDDYHSPIFQRFHLIQLLQDPPGGDTRYEPAWWYVQIAKELNMPIQHLARTLNQIQDKPYRYWRISLDEGGNEQWQAMYPGYAAIGWPSLGDLSSFSTDRDIESFVKDEMPKHYDLDEKAVNRYAAEIRRFCDVDEKDHNISLGDLIVAVQGDMVKGIGKFTDSYTYISGSPFPHRRPVKWESLDEWHLPLQEGRGMAVSELKRHTSNLIEIERKRLYADPVNIETPATVQRPLPRLDSIMEQIRLILERKGQVILYGPPGTGKTYWAQRTIRELAARSAFNQSFLTDRNTELDEKVQPYVQMCTFHPAYGYEDFIEGYRPEVQDDNMVFRLRDGIFKVLCAQASAEPEHNFYLIIDEINRGDIPRIFGELLTLLEKNKRGTSVILPVSGEMFTVPPNVCVIGTMNTADRSIALLDTALRRRFGFIELMPQPSLLADASVKGIPIDSWLDALNERIMEHIGRDARNLQIGHAYLMDKNGEPVKTFAMFKRILREDIIPLLEEYCYEDYETLYQILGEGLVDRHEQQIRFEVFEEGLEDNLVGALLQPTPEIMASAKAISAEAQYEQEQDSADEDEDENGS